MDSGEYKKGHLHSAMWLKCVKNESSTYHWGSKFSVIINDDILKKCGICGSPHCKGISVQDFIFSF